MRGWLGIAAVTLLLVGCGGGADPAVEACAVAAGQGLEGRDFALDREGMAANLKRDGNRGEIVSPFWLNKGLPNEIQQTMICVVQYDPAQPGAAPTVTSIQFQW